LKPEKHAYTRIDINNSSVKDPFPSIYAYTTATAADYTDTTDAVIATPAS